MGVRKGAYFKSTLGGGGGGGVDGFERPPLPKTRLPCFYYLLITPLVDIRVHTCVYVRKCTCTRIHVGTFSNDYVIHNFVRVYNSSPGPAKRTKKVLVIVPVPLRFK